MRLGLALGIGNLFFFSSDDHLVITRYFSWGYLFVECYLVAFYLGHAMRHQKISESSRS